MSDGRHGHGRQRDQLVRLQNAKWVGWLQPFLSTSGTRAMLAQVLPGVDTAMAIVPLHNETIGPILVEGHRVQRLRARSRHRCPPSGNRSHASVIIAITRNSSRSTGESIMCGIVGF